MSKKGKSGRAVRAAPGATILTSVDGWEVLCGSGYKPLWQCPEVQTCIGVYADLIGSMTIRLMKNGPSGDERVRDALARKIDVDPSRVMTRSPFMQTIVRAMMTFGNCAVLPVYTADGMLDDLRYIPADEVSYLPDDRDGYRVLWRGKTFRPDELLHFALNPSLYEPWRGTGFTVSLRDAVDGLRQGEATKNALLRSPAPSIIVKVDSLTEEFASKEGRAKLRAQYLDASEKGEPWLIPAEMFSIEQVKPLTLTDLAIRENLELDKKAVAAIFGVPAFLVGVGQYSRDEYRNFVSTRVMAVAKIIEQELTRKLLWADDRYFKFNFMTLYSYDLTELVTAGTQLVDHMAIRRNELRDWLGLSPDPEMDELLALENYVPANRLGDQEKLTGGGESDGTDEIDPADPDA